MLADHVLGTAEPHDRLVLAAVLARRGDLVALKAKHAAKPAGQVRRAKPRLAAARTRGPLRGARFRPQPLRSRFRSSAMKKPSVPSRSGLVSRRRRSLRSGFAASAASTTLSFSLRARSCRSNRRASRQAAARRLPRRGSGAEGTQGARSSRGPFASARPGARRAFRGRSRAGPPGRDRNPDRRGLPRRRPP